MAEPSGPVSVPGFIDAHSHLLKTSANIPFPWQETSVGDFHRKIASEGLTPMDVLEPEPQEPPARLGALLLRGLSKAAAAGLVEITEMGLRQWWYLNELTSLQNSGPLPVRVRVYLASGLAEQASIADLDARRSDSGPWVSVEGVKFYADGWLGPRTCAMCQPFADYGGKGLLFMDAQVLARRIEPFAANGWRVATHAIGDRAIETVLDAYDLVWAHDHAAIARAAPRVEHVSILSSELISRISESRVVGCIQPSFPVTDANHLLPGLGSSRLGIAYPWSALATSGARLLAGSDYPIEVLEPLVGLARLVNGCSQRSGFTTTTFAPEASRLDVTTALDLLSDPAAGRTLLSADPRIIPEVDIDRVEALGTIPMPFFEPPAQQGVDPS